MAKVYTKNELQKLVDAAYRLGFQDGQSRRGDSMAPPPLEAVAAHPLTGSNHPTNYPRPGRGRARRPGEPPPSAH